MEKVLYAPSHAKKNYRLKIKHNMHRSLTCSASGNRIVRCTNQINTGSVMNILSSNKKNTILKNTWINVEIHNERKSRTISLWGKIWWKILLLWSMNSIKKIWKIYKVNTAGAKPPHWVKSLKSAPITLQRLKNLKLYRKPF